MMNAVGGNPEDRSAFERHGAAGGDEVLKPLWNAVAAVRKQAMIGHADADVDCQEIHDCEDGEIFPCPEDGEERQDGADVEEAHGDGGDPVDAALLMLTAHAEVLLDFEDDFLDGDCGCSFGICNGDECSVHLVDLFPLKQR